MRGCSGREREGETGLCVMLGRISVCVAAVTIILTLGSEKEAAKNFT